MHLYQNLPLRHKLTLLSMVTATVAMLLACAGFVAYEMLTFKQDLVGDAATAAEMVGYSSASALSFNDANSAEETLQALSAQKDIIAACIYGKDGRVFATYPRGQPASSFGPPVSGTVDRLDSRRLELFRPIRVGDEEIGSIHLISDFSEIRERMRRLAWLIGTVMVITFLVAYFLASRLQRVISAPVSDLAAIVGRVAAQNDFSIRAARLGDDELGRLIDGFNEMLGQIQARDGALQAVHDSLERRVAERTRELREAQAEIAQEKDRLQFIFESVPVGICLDRHSPAGLRDRLINSAHLAICGLSREQVADGAFQRLTHPDDVAPQAALRRQLDAGAIDRFSVDKRYVRPDGQIVWVVFTMQRRRYPDGSGQDLTTVVDITALKHAQAVAAREQTRFKFIFDSVPVGISFAVNDRSNLHLVNPAHERITGVSAADSGLPGVFMRASHPDDYRRQTELALPFVRAEVDYYSVEKRYLHADGTVLWAVLTSRRFMDVGTGVAQTITTLVDITQRKEAETRLANSLSLLHATLESTADGILVVDSHQRLTTFNRTFVEMWHVSSAIMESRDNDRVLAITLDQIVNPEVFMRKVRELMLEPEADSFDVLELKDGRTIERYTQPQRVGQAVVGRVLCFRDVSDRKRAEAKLAEASAMLEAMLGNSPDWIYFKDRESRIALASRSKVQAALARVPDLRARRAARGLAPDVPEMELLNGLTDFDTLNDDDARVAYEDEQNIVRTGEPVIGKSERQIFLDGTTHWSLTSKMPWLDREGNTIGTFGISKDISDLKATEGKLEETHRQLLQTSRQAGMAEIATGVLHNVGNVLNSVNVSATLVSEQVRHSKAGNIAKLAALFAQHKATLGDFLTNDPRGQMIPGYLESLGQSLATEHKMMIEELEHLGKNVDHIKDIVSMQQAYARTSGVTETVSVPDLIADALRINAASLALHAIETVCDYQTRPVITTDKHKVLQILINLIGNANHACDESGRTDKRILVRTTSDDQGVKIAVVDNGVGIPAENLTRIFNHGFTTRKAGHGFGLHSGALAAKELGGSLRVTSDGPGLGATFTLELPVRSLTTAAIPA